MCDCVYELECAIQKYDWGKPGLESTVAKIAQLNNTKITIAPEERYAELWMGTHPNGPSKLKGSDKSLADLITQNPDVLGEEVKVKFGGQLPFLFKILSINKALSVQAHPNKSLAEELFAKHPDLYKDPNHKPELAIALTPFEALCGFRTFEELIHNFSTITELTNVIGEKNTNKFIANPNQENLRACFTGLMTCSSKIINSELNRLLTRIKEFEPSKRDSLNATVLEKLAAQYPGDVGCFSIYFLNYLTLQPGEALYLGPNEPHAYISGDCIECMACSDNVVRAGLTPKFKDVETLCAMLTYSCEPGSEKRFHPIIEDQYTSVFKPPVPDFAVARIEFPDQGGDYQLTRRTASILLILSGQGKAGTLKLVTGTVLFIPANKKMFIKVLSPLLMFQAIANV